MFAGILTMYGQGAKNIKINEVLTNTQLTFKTNSETEGPG